jgi:hypothetical protein
MACDREITCFHSSISCHRNTYALANDITAPWWARFNQFHYAHRELLCKLSNMGAMPIFLDILIQITIIHTTYALKMEVGGNYSSPDIFSFLCTVYIIQVCRPYRIYSINPLFQCSVTLFLKTSLVRIIFPSLNGISSSIIKALNQLGLQSPMLITVLLDRVNRETK